MSLVSESPLHSSSSSDDFATYLEGELDLASAPSSSGEEEDGSEVGNGVKSVVVEESESVVEAERIKRRRLAEDEERPFELRSDNLQINKEEPLLQEESGICPPHPGSVKGLCFRCAKPIDDDDAESEVALRYIHKDLKLRSNEIERLRELDLRKLLHAKKLILVLDLDHTLLNSTRFMDISPDEEYLLKDADMMQGDLSKSLFKLQSMHLLTKLRPFVHTFLREASSMYEMCIYTMAERSYAMEIAKLLDPSGAYFNSRVISQSDCTQRYQKGLDVVLGAESTVLILDDTEMVWQKHRENLILMERYHYFGSSCKQFHFNQVSLSVAKKDECETDGVLASILNVLKRVHHMFFDSVPATDFSSRDVRLVLRKVRQEVLQGCRVVFSRLFPSASRAEDQHIWKKCEQLGATCLAEVDSSVTHVISNDKGTQKARWAVQNEKFLVNPGWVEAAFYLWRRMPENDFPVTNSRN